MGTGRNNIYQSYIFQGFAWGGVCVCPSFDKKNIFDQYSAVDNSVDKVWISLAICNHSCILRIIRLLKKQDEH